MAFPYPNPSLAPPGFLSGATISIGGTGIYAGQDLTGDISAFSLLAGKTTTDVSFTADWSTIPPLVQGQLGTATGQDAGSVIYLNTGSAQSVDVLITPAPAPEPSSLLPLGLDLVGCGIIFMFMRLKLTSRV